MGSNGDGFPRPFGRYLLERALSSGGMGDVYVAIARGVHRRCVVKTIRTELHGEEEFVGRFADEAKIMVRIDHPNIIRVFDAGKVRNDYYIAMEYVHGKDLGDVLDRAYERYEVLPVQVGLYIASEILAGLGYVHELVDETGRHMELVHRDVSPQNVLIGFDGSVKLIDFGLARSRLLPSRTLGSLAIGKYGYMSPEQARHLPLDGRADLYSAAVMLFEVFTGERLVDEQDQSTLWERVLNPDHRRPKSVLPSLPSEVDELIVRAFAADREDRFADAREMKAAVDGLRTKNSSPHSLANYLRDLYPTDPHAPDDIPDLSEFDGEVQDSLIIVTSRQKQRSMFGRGELPIEGTLELDPKQLQELVASASRDALPPPASTDDDSETSSSILTLTITGAPVPESPTVEISGPIPPSNDEETTHRDEDEATGPRSTEQDEETTVVDGTPPRAAPARPRSGSARLRRPRGATFRLREAKREPPDRRWERSLLVGVAVATGTFAAVVFVLWALGLP